MITSFKPIVGNNCKILILGSMPSIESLRRQEYYAFKRNQFWKIMFELLGKSISNSYETKKQLLLDNNIALWDVLKSCDREGSLDSNIKNEVVNDFSNFFKQYPSIEYVLFNGTKAESSFKKHVGFNTFKSLRYHRLPSTSPANTVKYDEKFKVWQETINSIRSI
ncbi:DNA-deoxyinosine glycosylase [Clostridiaceae bacterium M8S5]|nr:DNA-deoxyinosine glycosylase [Clostridiaceae bacterium M8S5]